MSTVQRIEKKGYKVVFFMDGSGVQASKGLTKVTAQNVTQLLKKLM